MTQNNSLNRLRQSFESPKSWLWYIGIFRIGILAIVAIGTWLTRPQSELTILLAVYGAALISGLAYLAVVSLKRLPATLFNWAQIIVDLLTVGVTVHFSNGPTSIFAFLFVVVVVESGLILGVGQGFVFSSAASLFMLLQTYWYLERPGAPDVPSLIYNFCVQSLAFYLTAFISGYWSQRINRMQYFHREILDNMNSGFLIADKNGIVVSLNRVGQSILNLADRDAEGQPVENVLRVEHASECPIITAIRSRRDFSSYEFHAITGPRQAKLLGLTTSRLTDSQGRLTGVIASFSDLTEMSRLRQELQRQDRMAAVGELAAGLAHEIRNPVAAIRGAADELGSNVNGEEQLTEKLTNIMIRESDHLNEIVTGFLEFASKPIQRLESFDVRELVDEVKDFLDREYSDAPNLKIVAQYPQENCTLSGDKTQIRQVFVNLGKNAVEAMHEKGTLSINVIKNGGPLEIRFEDEGEGIDPDKVSRIFEPFYTTKESGVGIGLALCLRIITAHDGSLRASSREGGGTTMRVILPTVRPVGNDA